MDDCSAQCNTCDKRISCDGGCTTNMAKHLRQQHGIQIKECTAFDMLRRPPSSSQASSSSVSPAQSTASTFSPEPSPPPCKTVRMTPLEELFTDEDAVKMTSLQTSTSIQDRVEKELQMYKDMPPIVTSDDPAAWWWNM
ncbi:hypothetical protein ABVT39_007557 [Epinephelus coioides]